MADRAPAAALLARSDDWGRAPSAHNTQPWRVTAAGPTTLVLGWDPDRVLTVGDPTGRDLLLSLGCVVEALAVTAADLGYAAAVTWDVDRTARRAALIELVSGHPSIGTGCTVAELRTRRTARAAYADPGPGPAQVARVASHAALGADLRLLVLGSEVAEAALQVADRWTFQSGPTTELRDWLRLDPRDPRYDQDGLSDAALGLGRWESRGLALALRPPVLALLRRTRLTRALARTATARPLGTVVLLAGPQDPTEEATAEAGRALLRAWVVGERAGWSAHPLSQLLDCPAGAALVRPELPVGTEPYAVWRLGMPRRPAVRSARLTDRRTG